MTIGWQHPIDTADQWDGFNEPGIEHFAGSPTKNLAREVNQNSLDAKDDDRPGAVRVVIRSQSVPTSSVPNLDQLKKTLELCRRAARNESPKARQFFEAALKELARSTLRVLTIEDFNTRGIAGPSTNGTPFYAFTKAKGQSKKQSDVATGSFGIGKFAPYAVSKLRTVFVSTVYRTAEGSYEQLTQGKSILMSHDEDGLRHQGVGFWGHTAKCQPVVDDEVDLSAWVLRADRRAKYKSSLGTRLSVLGFDGRPGWEKLLAGSVAENFFGAIVDGKLEVSIEDQYTIDATTIGDVLIDPEIIEAMATQKGEPDQLINSATYLSCLLESPDVKVERMQHLYLGLCELRLRVAEGLPKKVCALRNGMFISDSLGLPGLKNFSDFKDFAAVFQCRGSEGVELLRAMEPPRHDDFEPDRLPPEEQEKGRKALRDLAKWVREMLKRHAKDPVSDVTSVDELKEYFAEEGDEGSGEGQEEVNPYGTIVLRPKPLPYGPTITLGLSIGDAKGNNEGPDGGGGGDGTGKGDGEGGHGDGTGGTGGGESRKPFPVSNPRAILTSAKRRRVAFTPARDGNVELALFEAGADSDYVLPIVTGSTGKLVDGKLTLQVKANERQVVEVQLGEEFLGAIKVAAHEV